jgi:hypothetical protein
MGHDDADRTLASVTGAESSSNHDSPRPRTRSARAGLAGVVAIVLMPVLAACGGGAGASVPQFCDGLAAFNSRAGGLGSGSIAPLGKSQLTSLANDMRKLATKAPSAVRADVITVSEFFQKASEHGMGSVDSATTAAANDAGDRIATFAEANCGAPPS